MDYERKHKEEVVRATQLWENGDITRGQLEYIFPELKESGDERVWLIKFIQEEIYCLHFDVRDNDDRIKLENLRRSLAWLEKQNKDGKKWIYEDVYLKEKEQLYQDGVDDVLENPHKYGLEKQGQTFTKKDADDAYLKGVCDAKSELEKQDKSKFEQCIKDGDKIVTNEDGTHFNVSQLERVANKEPKSAWSEEDELTRNSLLNLVEMYYGECIKKEEKNRLLDWLKSLKERMKPQWKPSDGQILALDEVYKTHGANNVCRRIIFNLLEQLKKL